jgi:dihydroxyacetone kinase
MRKLLNDPRRVVRDALEGFADLNPGLALLDTKDVIVRVDLPPPQARQVAVLSGGGSGHEPAHAGYVGAGTLSAAIARRRVCFTKRGCGARRDPCGERTGGRGVDRQELHR